MQKKLKAAEIASDVDDAKRARDIFIHQMSPHVIKCLQKYKKKDFQIGRKSFKTLARKVSRVCVCDVIVSNFRTFAADSLVDEERAERGSGLGRS